MVARATVAGTISKTVVPSTVLLSIFQGLVIGIKNDSWHVKFKGNSQDESISFSMQKGFGPPPSADKRSSSIPMYSMRSITKQPSNKNET